MTLFLITVAVIIAFILIISYICFRMAFYVPTRKGIRVAKDVLSGPEYDDFRENIKKWVNETQNTPHQEFMITSFDGLRLYGNYYELSPNAPIEIMFHGYRGSAERDLAGGMRRAFDVGHSALIVDQRCCGKSDGNVITFGINEYRDCLKWVRFVIDKFGKDVKIVLTGISMGASTVLIAASTPLPPNVIGVLADCGYTSAKDIIKKVIKGMRLPAGIAYPFVRLGAKIYGHFDLEEISPISVLKNCKIPVIFYHGEDDDFVPSEMSDLNFSAVTAKKKLIKIKGAAHGLSYPVAPKYYTDEMKKFFSDIPF